MNLMDRIAAVFKRGAGEVRPQNVTYDQSILEAFEQVFKRYAFFL